MNYVFFVSSSNSLSKNDCRGRRGLFDSAGSNTDPLGELGPAQVPDCHLGAIRRKVAGRELCVMGKTCGRLCVRPQRRVNCASHRSQAKAVLSTGTHCMCRQVLHRTFVPRTTVSARSPGCCWLPGPLRPRHRAGRETPATRSTPERPAVGSLLFARFLNVKRFVVERW